MKDFEYNIERVLGYNCPDKSLLNINGETICFANGETRLKSILEYAYTLDENRLIDGKIKRRIKKILGVE